MNIPGVVPTTCDSDRVLEKTLNPLVRSIAVPVEPDAVRTFTESVVKPLILSVTFEPPSPLLTSTATDSLATVDVKFTVAVIETVSPGFAEAELALNVVVVVAELKTAEAGPVERTPNPNAATKASATRLNDTDLLVICFLS